MTYESHKKAGLHPFSRKYIFGKTKGGVKLTPHPKPFLDLISPDEVLMSVTGSLQSSTQEKMGTFILSSNLYMLHYGPGMSSKVKHKVLL